MRVEPQPDPPEHLYVGPPNRQVRYVLRHDLVALHGPRSTTVAAPVVFSLPAAGVEVLAVVEVAVDDARGRGPVYAQEPSGQLVVPTGRIFLRFGKPGRPADWVERLRQLGLAPVEGHRDAPGTAWVAPVGERIAAGLARLDRLASLPEVEGAEPELLRESRRR